MNPRDISRRSIVLGALGAATVGSTAEVVVDDGWQGPSLEVFASGFAFPWALAFLPDGSMLVGERVGRMRRVSADGRTVSAPLSGVPAVVFSGNGGLLDVVLAPGSVDEVYWVYVEADHTDDGLSGVVVARARLVGNRLRDVRTVFRQSPKYPGDVHQGARLAFAPDGMLLVALGERQLDNPWRPGRAHAQHPASSLGKVLRLTPGGAPAPDNPVIDGAMPGVWTLGHRNPQALAVHPQTGDVWLAEHGPLGGDELNVLRPGRNYGWPLRSYGCPYGSPDGVECRVGGGVHAPDFEEPAAVWPLGTLAPSGMVFYTGDRYPAWRGDMFIGALVGSALWRVTLAGTQVVAREALFKDRRERVRDVRQGPDGRLYLLTDGHRGSILRTAP